jgi:hypothetical protein
LNSQAECLLSKERTAARKPLSWRADAAGRIITDTDQTVSAAGIVMTTSKVQQGQRSGRA